MSLGYTADVATTGVEVIAQVKKRRELQQYHPMYSLILMDDCMPDMDGLKAARKIRKLLRHKSEHPQIDD